MSILIIGDDHDNEIQKLYQSYGAYNTQYWSNCECFESLPENINGLVLLQDECNHCLLSKYKQKASTMGLPYVCIKKPNRAPSEFVKLYNTIHDKWLENL